MTFEQWWLEFGSAITPNPSEDKEEHAKRVAEAAYHKSNEEM